MCSTRVLFSLTEVFAMALFPNLFGLVGVNLIGVPYFVFSLSELLELLLLAFVCKERPVECVLCDILDVESTEEMDDIGDL